MSKSEPDYEGRVQEFHAALIELEVREVVRKYITTGMPAAIAEKDYYDLRRDVAKEFKLHPNAVVLIGSCRVGFSLKPNKLYAPTHSNSDLDLALVSMERFDDFWDRVFHYAKFNPSWDEKWRFEKSLFNGWIDPRWLPPVPRFETAKHWIEFFDTIMRSRRFGTRRLTARLYRTWEHLESYQERMVRRCRDDLRRTTS